LKEIPLSDVTRIALFPDHEPDVAGALRSVSRFPVSGMAGVATGLVTWLTYWSMDFTYVHVPDAASRTDSDDTAQAARRSGRDTRILEAHVSVLEIARTG
jgi:hypothetical protein